MARAIKYDEKVADEICQRLAEGETLRAICRESHLPNWQRIYDWIGANEEFAGRIARARELGADAIAEQALSIADTPEIGEEVEESENGMKVKRADMLGHRKLQVETRLKLLAKWFPKKYGDRQEIDLNVNSALSERLARAKKRGEG